MAYDTETLKTKAIEVIKKNRLIFVEDVCAMIGINKTTFYNHFPINGNDFDELIKMIDENKITLKVGLRKKWFDSDNATTQMALYKLCSTSEEHKKLQQNYTDVTSGDKPIQPTVVQLTDEQVKDAIERL
jgi:alpha-galactosidase/6-phospho-beta-glucosidase family protein